MRFELGHFTEHETPHVVFPPPDRVFGTRAAKYDPWLKPLLTVDLASINPDWSGKAHFLYFESAGLAVEFTVKDDIYRLRRGYSFLQDDDGPVPDPDSVVTDLEEIFELDAYEELLDDDGETTRAPTPRGSLLRSRFLHLTSVDLPPPAEHRRGEWYEAAESMLRAKAFGPYARDDGHTPIPPPDTLMFGGHPCWLQSDATPRDPDGRRMEFVGQVDASRFSADIGGMFYLFHAPAAKLVTMVAQIG